MRLTRKTQPVEKVEKKEEIIQKVDPVVEEAEMTPDIALSDDVDAFVPDDVEGVFADEDEDTFVADELTAADFMPIEDDSDEWNSIDTEIEGKDEDYIDDTMYDSATYKAEIEVPDTPEPEVSEVVEEKTDEVAETTPVKTPVVQSQEKKEVSKMNLREKLQKINENNNVVLTNIDKALVEAAMAQNCTSCVVTVDRPVSEDDFVMNYLSSNGLDVINVEVQNEESKLTISWE